MNKIVTTIMMMVMVAGSYGDIKISWAAPGGFFWDNNDANTFYGGQPYTPNDPFVGAGTFATTRAQLMYSPDLTQDAGNLATGIGTDGLGFNGGNDTILTTFDVVDDGLGYAYFDAGLFAGWYAAGYAYAMIFQDSALDVGDWYYYSPMVQLSDIAGTTLPQSIMLGTDPVNGDPVGADSFGVTSGLVIPEPSTALLLGTGGLVVWLGRRKFNRDVGTKVTPKKMQKVNLLHR